MGLTTLDIRTILVVLAATTGFSGVTLVVLHHGNRKIPGLGLFAPGCFCLAAGSLLLAYQNTLPDLLSIAVGDTLVGLAIALTFEGVRRLYGGIPRRAWLVALALASLAGFSYFTVLRPNLPARVMLISAILSVLGLAGAWIAFRHRRPDPLSTAAFLIAGLALTGLVNAVRLGFGTTIDSLFSANVFTILTIPATMLGFLSVSAGVLTTVAQRHLSDLRRSLHETRAAMQAKNEFFASMSHKARVPIDGVLGLTETLLGTDLTEEQRSLTDAVHESAAHLKDTLEDALERPGTRELRFGSGGVPDVPRETATPAPSETRAAGPPGPQKPAAARPAAARPKSLASSAMATVDSFLPEDFPGDAPANRWRERILVLTCWGTALAFLTGTALRLAVTALPTWPLGILLGEALVLTATPWVLRLTGGSVLAAGRIATFSMTAAVFSFAWLTAGPAQPILVATPLLPLFGTFLVNRRTGIVLALTVAALLVLLLVLHGGTSAAPDTTSRTLNTVLTVFVMTLIASVYEHQRIVTQEALALESAAAHQKSSAKGSFLSDMSHEIRTPISSILGVTELLGRRDLPGDVREYVDVIKSSGDALLHLVNGILDLSKIEAGGVTMEKVGFRLADPIHGVGDLVRLPAKEKGVELVLDVDDRLPEWVRGDPARLRQVLLNLAGNAVKFTSEGRVVLAARLARRAGHDAWVRFTVSDTGIGMDPKAFERLFRPYTQAEASIHRRFGGTGLGLVISQRIVELLGGNIEAESIPGEGSTFSFTLPFQALDKPPETTEPLEAVPQARPSRESYHILVADDNTVNLLIAERFLEGLGYSVDAVGSGQAVLEALQHRRYDAVLMDCEMPGLDGYETCRRIRQSGMRQVPVIAVTANALKDDRDRCMAAGMDDHLPKPYDSQDLARVLERWLPVEEGPGEPSSREVH